MWAFCKKKEKYMTKIFVYGTLKRGFRAHSLMKGATFLREAITKERFQLYDVGSFPSIAEDPDKKGGVKGELFDATDEVMKVTDRYECIEDGLFRKDEVELEDGTKAISYFCNCSLEGARQIENGVWE
jgi:gamma-glutamylcyclotransferase (GGCT)/AIG2-like uncharacterized protein YtfP